MDTWNRMKSWELVLPPSRPSQQHLDWFRKHATELRMDDPIAILGSTPELCDMLALLGFRDVYLLERNVAFLGKNGSLTCENDLWHGDGVAGRLDADAAQLRREICCDSVGLN